MKKTVKILSVAGLASLALAATVWSNVPPPPANQYLYIYDTTMDQQTREVCIQCHFDPTKTVAQNDTALATRHHNLVQTKGLQCSNCHKIMSDTSLFPTDPAANTSGIVYSLDEFRRCEFCHAALGSPHHKTTWALNKDCKHCHGMAIDNPDGQHYIPTYEKSMTTPKTKGNLITDTQTNLPMYIGGCQACHAEDLKAKDPRPFANNTTRPIYSNADTHHAIGLPAPNYCNTCHNWPPVPGQAMLDIRMCEGCHSVATLHNIQKPNPNRPVPFQEPLGFGHIGNNWDCWGCHGWFDKYATAADVPGMGTLVPFVSGLSTSMVKVNTPTEVTITGVNLVSTASGTDAAPTVLVGGKEVTPTAVTDSSITFIAPALTLGSHDVVVKKADKVSNLLKLVASQKVAIKSAIMSASGNLTITGEGFGTMPPILSIFNTGVRVNGVLVKVSNWSNTSIVVSVPGGAPGNKVTVGGLFGASPEFVATAPTKKSR